MPYSIEQVFAIHHHFIGLALSAARPFCIGAGRTLLRFVAPCGVMANRRGEIES